jgi:hypothetical protein
MLRVPSAPDNQSASNGSDRRNEIGIGDGRPTSGRNQSHQCLPLHPGTAGVGDYIRRSSRSANHPMPRAAPDRAFDLAHDRSSRSPGPRQLRHRGDVEQGPASAPILLMTRLAMPGASRTPCLARRRSGGGGRTRTRGEGGPKVPLQKNFDTHLRPWFHGEPQAFPLAYERVLAPNPRAKACPATSAGTGEVAALRPPEGARGPRTRAEASSRARTTSSRMRVRCGIAGIVRFPSSPDRIPRPSSGTAR